MKNRGFRFEFDISSLFQSKRHSPWIKLNKTIQNKWYFHLGLLRFHFRFSCHVTAWRHIKPHFSTLQSAINAPSHRSLRPAVSSDTLLMRCRKSSWRLNQREWHAECAVWVSSSKYGVGQRKTVGCMCSFIACIQRHCRLI